MIGNAKSKKHTAKHIAMKVDATTTNRGGATFGMAAGLGTGAVCQVARGIKSMAVVGAIGGLTGGAAVAAKQAMKRYVPI
ncbi:hypothetical protein WN944_003577 [Citrus x changshan-huyou]|uniref:Uncharacterized protein n=1 Tax=Citrus x changshan-huyou TaxID=2935761 RepID=A0AAP0QI48_9ROSI